MTIFSVVFLALVLTIEKLLRLGIILGRGNTVGGIGLVLALIGFSFEVTQVLSRRTSRFASRVTATRPIKKMGEIAAFLVILE